MTLLSQSQSNVLRSLRGDPSNAVYTATSVNGDDVKGLWTDKAVHSLSNAAKRVLQKVIRVVHETNHNSEFQVLVNKPTLSLDERKKLTRTLLQMDFVALMVKELRKEVDVLAMVLTNLSNNVFVAASTRLVQGLNDQFAEDEDLFDVPVVFDFDDEMTPNKLVVLGVPGKQYFEMMFSALFTEQWFITTIIHTLESSQSYKMFQVRVDALVEARMKKLYSMLRDVAQDVAQSATLRATEQFSNIQIKVE